MYSVDGRTELLQRLRSREALICVVGLGYVGLPLSLTFTESGFRVLGLDDNPEKIDALKAGKNYIAHINCKRVARADLSSFLEVSLDIVSAYSSCATPRPRLGLHRTHA
jgi:UDP-N-acetyl-D-glucosamine dehydrogenase